MKIGIQARFLLHPYTGIGQYTRSILHGLSKVDKDNEYFLFTPEHVELDLPKNFQQIRVVEKNYKSDSYRKWYWEHKQVPQEMEAMEMDLAHFLYPANPNRKMKIPVVVTVHDVIPWKLKAYRKKMRSRAYHFNAKQALKKVDHIVTVSNFSAEEIKTMLNLKDKDITVIYEAAPHEEAAKNFPKLSLRRQYFLYVGGYDERKNVAKLILAYQKHVGNTYPIDLILVGGKDRGYEVLITDDYLEKVGNIVVKPKGNVIFTESLSSEELQCMYREAYAFVNVSEYEGFNLPLVEAMEHGIPIVTSNIEVHREVTDNSAVFVDPHHIDTIGLGLHELVNNPPLYKDLQRAGKERSQFFDWKLSAEELLDVYNQFT